MASLRKGWTVVTVGWSGIRESIAKPKGELTEADLAKVTKQELSYNQITDASLKEVAKLKRLAKFYFGRTQATDAGIAELKRPCRRAESTPD